MLKQVATAGRSAAFLNGFDKASVIFQHPVNRFLNYLRSLFTCTCSELTQAGFFVRREMDFHFRFYTAPAPELLS